MIVDCCLQQILHDFLGSINDVTIDQEDHIGEAVLLECHTKLKSMASFF